MWAHAMCTHSRELVSVAVSVYQYQSVCACVRVCRLSLSLSLFISASWCLWNLTSGCSASLYLSSLNGLVRHSLPQYLEARLREPGWPGFVGSSPYKRVQKGPL